MTIVVIPIYKDKPSEMDINVIDNTISKLKDTSICNLCFICPEGITKREYIQFGIDFECFDKKYFKSEDTYSRLLLTKEFYSRFKDRYEYMLIVQTDVWILGDANMLEQYVKKQCAYIGAPWIDGVEAYSFAFKGISLIKRFFHPRTLYIGNGGLSLRNIRSHIIILSTHWASAKIWNSGEDVFFSYYLQRDAYKLPTIEEAEGFALEKNARKVIESGRIPFGVHAWEKYYPELNKE